LRRYGKNRRIMQNISEYPTLTYFTGLVGVLVGMIIQIFVWWSPKGCCYSNQLNMGDVRKRRVEWPLLFASAFDNGFADRKSAFKWFNGDDQGTSCPNLANFLGVYAVKMYNFCRDSPAIWRRSSFVTLSFHNGLEDHNSDFSIVIGSHFCIYCRNLVRFTSVTAEFKTSEVGIDIFFCGDFRDVQ